MTQIKTLEATLETTRQDLQKKQDELADCKFKRQNTSEREENLAAFSEAKRERTELEAKLSVNAENDPANIEKLVDATKLCAEGANRWTDNTWTLKSYVVDKMNMDVANVEKWLEMKSDFDYVPDL